MSRIGGHCKTLLAQFQPTAKKQAAALDKQSPLHHISEAATPAARTPKFESLKSAPREIRSKLSSVLVKAQNHSRNAKLAKAAVFEQGFTRAKNTHSLKFQHRFDQMSVCGDKAGGGLCTSFAQKWLSLRCASGGSNEGKILTQMKGSNIDRMASAHTMTARAEASQDPTKIKVAFKNALQHMNEGDPSAKPMVVSRANLVMNYNSDVYDPSAKDAEPISYGGLEKRSQADRAENAANLNERMTLPSGQKERFFLISMSKESIVPAGNIKNAQGKGLAGKTLANEGFGHAMAAHLYRDDTGDLHLDFFDPNKGTSTNKLSGQGAVTPSVIVDSIYQNYSGLQEPGKFDYIDSFNVRELQPSKS